ncbi:hypothetical protein A3715_15350 [Oleiphilus sp. HI0009]|nr:hypothetical protein A3715_15350 [Oleiphilus sp. HI0009]
MVIPPFSVLAITAFIFFRKEMVVAILCFFAGGILTLKSDVVRTYMVKAEKIYDQVIYPDMVKTKDQVEKIINENR